MTENTSYVTQPADTTHECPYLSGKKAEKCPWIKTACQAWKLQQKGLSERAIKVCFDTVGSATKITKEIWDEKAAKGRR